MTRPTKVEMLRALIRKLGGTGRGNTTAELLDELEDYHSPGGEGQPIDTGGLDDGDMDDVFEGGE